MSVLLCYSGGVAELCEAQKTERKWNIVLSTRI